MANWKQIGTTVVVAGVAFFIGYEGVPFMLSKIQEYKDKQKSKKAIEDKVEKIKADVQGSNFPAEYEVKFSNGSYVIQVTVDNDKAKGFFEKYIAKNSLEGITVKTKIN